MYFKILSGDLKQHNMQYKEGLNVDILPFNPAPECGEGGLYFADEKHILSCCNYGDKIAVVTIPEGELVVSVDFYDQQKYKAHRIILSEIRDLWTVETFKYLVGLGANIHAADDYVLCSAASNGHLEIVKYLVEAGADIHADADVALCSAVNNGHLEIVKCLVETGANIHADDDKVLEWAVYNGNLEIVKYLKSKI